ncbi:MAG: extracellular solute-binding protein [Opitutus sp.]
MSLAAALVLTGCGKKDAAPAPAGATTSASSTFPGMEADLAATMKAQSDFYRTAPLSAIPADLKWETGAELPEFSDPNAKEGGTFRYYIADFPRTLRTIGPDATGGIRPYLLDFVAINLVHAHPNVANAAFPGLAREWAADPKTKTVYFRLDPDARFADGKPVTTADIVFSFYFFRSPHLRQPWYNDFYTKTFSSITVYDAYTVAYTLADWKPDAVLRAGADNSIYPRHFFSEFGPDWLDKYQWRAAPLTGAYELTDANVEKGRSITLTAVKNWWARDKKFWRHRYNPARYRFDVIREPDKIFEAFTRGDLDLFRLDQPKFWYESLPDSHPLVASGYITKTKFFNRIPRPSYGLWINRTKPALDNRDIREGLHFATNFDLVCSQYFRGDARRLDGQSDGYTDWDVGPGIRARPFDPVKARALFSRAGYTEQGPDGILRNAAGQRLSFTITTGDQTLRDPLSIIQQEALKAGVEYKLEVLDRTTGFKKVQEKNHEIGLVALASSVEVYPRYWETYHGSNAYEDAYLRPDGSFTDKASEGTPNPAPKKIRVQTNNMTETFVPEMDRLIESYDRAETFAAMKPLSARIEELIQNDAAWVNGWQLPFHRAGYWRYVKWPATYNVAHSRYPDEFFLHWIDQDEKKAVEDARRSGRTFPAQILTFDQFKK